VSAKAGLTENNPNKRIGKKKRRIFILAVINPKLLLTYNDNLL